MKGLIGDVVQLRIVHITKPAAVVYYIMNRDFYAVEPFCIIKLLKPAVKVYYMN